MTSDASWFIGGQSQAPGRLWRFFVEHPVEWEAYRLKRRTPAGARGVGSQLALKAPAVEEAVRIRKRRPQQPTGVSLVLLRLAHHTLACKAQRTRLAHIQPAPPLAAPCFCFLTELLVSALGLC